MLEDMNPKTTRHKSPCLPIERVKEHPDTTEKDVQLLLDYLADPSWGDKQLATALTKKGIKAHSDQIIRHREKRCPCWKQNTQ